LPEEAGGAGGVSARERLGRIFGPDTLELLGTFIGERIEEVLSRRDHERRWLPVGAAAEYLGMSEKAVRRRIERGTITYTRHGSRILVDRRALDDELAKQSRNYPLG
jgi:excisionase family DNA binding protein